jgi:hypothetical protein
MAKEIRSANFERRRRDWTGPAGWLRESGSPVIRDTQSKAVHHGTTFITPFIPAMAWPGKVQAKG